MFFCGRPRAPYGRRRAGGMGENRQAPRGACAAFCGAVLGFPINTRGALCWRCGRPWGAVLVSHCRGCGARPRGAVGACAWRCAPSYARGAAGVLWALCGALWAAPPACCAPISDRAASIPRELSRIAGPSHGVFVYSAHHSPRPRQSPPR